MAPFFIGEMRQIRRFFVAYSLNCYTGYQFKCMMLSVYSQRYKPMTASALSIESSSLEDIKELNLSYLMVAQRLLREDYAVGLYRLGINDDVAQVLLKLSMSQLLALACTPSVICGFRLNDMSLLSSLAHDNMRGALQQARTTLALSQTHSSQAQLSPA